MSESAVPTPSALCADDEYRHMLFVNFQRGFFELVSQDEMEEELTEEEEHGFAHSWRLPVILDETVWDEVTATLATLVAHMPKHCGVRWDGEDFKATFDAEGEAIIQEIDDLIEDSWKRLEGDWMKQDAKEWCRHRVIDVTAGTTDLEIWSMYEDLNEEALWSHILLPHLYGYLLWLRWKAKSLASNQADATGTPST